MIDISVYNALGNSVTKYASCSNRATVNTSKVVIVWAFFLIYPGDGGETFHWLQLGGFILIVIGTFAFNYIKDNISTTKTENSDVSDKNINPSEEGEQKLLSNEQESMLVSI
mmetsp:Transcript_6908/g.6062  ORF Transcript_6908/g.6062 Transcript_6908/m.6062 type:complete len:112 (+) Transcript_6908:824-1159(+)